MRTAVRPQFGRRAAARFVRVWLNGDGGKAPLSMAKHACDQLARACDSFAHAIDTAHSRTESKLAEAGITIGLTTAIGAVFTLFTLGGSDAAAGALTPRSRRDPRRRRGHPRHGSHQRPPPSTVTYRRFSKSGGPTIDMNDVGGLDAKRLHIPQH